LVLQSITEEFSDSICFTIVDTNYSYGRAYIKSVKIYVTDSSATPNKLDNGIEILTDNDILTNLMIS